MRWILASVVAAILLSLVGSVTLSSGPTPPWSACNRVCEVGAASGDSCINKEETRRIEQNEACNSWGTYQDRVVQFWLNEVNRDSSVIAILRKAFLDNLVGLFFIVAFGSTSTGLFGKWMRTLRRDRANTSTIQILSGQVTFGIALKDFHLSATNLMRATAPRFGEPEAKTIRNGLNALDQMNDFHPEFPAYKSTMEELVGDLASSTTLRKTNRHYELYEMIAKLFLNMASDTLNSDEKRNAEQLDIHSGPNLRYGGWTVPWLIFWRGRRSRDENRGSTEWTSDQVSE